MKVFRYSFLILLFLVLSCEGLGSNKHKINSPEVIDFSVVDSPPYFKDCEDVSSPALKKCFEVGIAQVFSQIIEANIQANTSGITCNETIVVYLKITKQGALKIDKCKASRTFKQQFPKFEKSLIRSVSKQPLLLPALKRGIPVTTIYKLPIKINVN